MSRRRKDHYEALGISRDADQDEIRAAYRNKAKRHHPDLSSSGDPRAFQEAQNAYDTLRDPKSRRAYDAELRRSETGFGARPGGAPPGTWETGGFTGGAYRRGSSTSPLDDLEAMVEELLRGGFGGGGGPRRRGPFPDEDPMYPPEGGEEFSFSGASGRSEPVEFDVHMSPDEAFTGVTAHLQLDEGGTVVVDIPPGVQDGHVLRAQFEDRFGVRSLRINVRVV